MTIEIHSTTVFEGSPSDRMQVLGRGELPLPGACLSCGSGVYEEGYLFLGVHVEFHGALLLCGLCLLQAGEKFGLMSPDVAHAIHNQAVDLAEEVTRLRTENEAQRVRLEVFDTALSSISSGNVGSDSSPTVDSGSLKSPEQLSDEAAQSEPTESEPESDESGKGDGVSKSSATTVGDLTAPRSKRSVKNVRIS